MRLLAAAALWLMCSALPASAEMVYHRGNPGDPSTLDAQLTSTVVESDILLDMFEGLVTYDASANIVPGAAESWTVNADATLYTFTLRADGRWSNGDPVRAGDFVFALRRLMDPATGAKYANILYTIKNSEKVNKGEAAPQTLGVRAVDDRTLEIALENSAPYFIAQLAHTTAMPLHQASVEKFGKDFVRPENLVVNGAFTLKEFIPNDHITLLRNPTFRDAGTVKIDREVIYPLEDRAAGLRRFQAGEIDTYNDAPGDQIKFIRDTLKEQFRLAPLLGTYYYVFNTRKKPFDDVRVRQALSMIVDREFLAEQIWGGAMTPAYSFVPPGVANAGPATAMAFRDLSALEREDMALALMKAAGYGPGGKKLSIEIRYNTSENHKNTSVALADMWKPLNVETRLVNTDIKTHYALLREKGDFDVARAGWSADYSDPQNFLFLGQSNNSGLNYATWTNAAFDALMAAAERQTVLAQRGVTLSKAEALLLEETPYLPLLFYSSKNLVSRKVEGWRSNVLDRHLARYISIKP